MWHFYIVKKFKSGRGGVPKLSNWRQKHIRSKNLFLFKKNSKARSNSFYLKTLFCLNCPLLVFHLQCFCYSFFNLTFHLKGFLFIFLFKCFFVWRKQLKALNFSVKFTFSLQQISVVRIRCNYASAQKQKQFKLFFAK